MFAFTASPYKPADPTARRDFSILPSPLTAIAVCTALLPLQALAQSFRPDAGSVLQRQNTTPPSIPSPPPAVLPSRITPPPALDTPASATVAVKGFVFSGNTVFSASQLAPLVCGLAGQSVTIAGLNQATDRVRQFYRERGYFLARAYLPRQDITAGMIEIAVLEGRVGRIEATLAPPAANRGASRLRESFAQAVIDANFAPGELITETALERPLLLLDDLPGVRVQSSLGAGTAVGTADIDVTIGLPAHDGPLSQATDGWVTGSADIDNHGNRFTGEWRLGATINVNNTTGYGDQLSVRGQVSPSNGHTDFGRIAWQTPVGYHGTQIGMAYARLDYTLIKDFSALLAEGDARIASFYVTHPLVRTRNLNFNLLAGFDRKDTEDRMLAVNSVETRRISIGHIGVQGDARDNIFGGGLTTFGITHSGGRVRIDQAVAVAADQAATGPHTLGNFNKTNVEFLRLQTLTQNVNVLGTVNTQFASKNLSSAEKMSLGGASGGSGVRAYPAGEASGDEGYVGTLEARYGNPAWRIGSASTVLSVFYDFGRVHINKNPQPGVANTRSLHAVGIGATIGKDGDFLVRASLAWRAGSERAQSDSDRSPRFWLQAIKSF